MPMRSAPVANATHRPGPPRPQPRSAIVSLSATRTSAAIRSSSLTLTALNGSNPAGYSSPNTSRQTRSATADGLPAYACSNSAFQSRSVAMLVIMPAGTSGPRRERVRSQDATEPRCLADLSNTD
jgi:hypothetical protein